MRRHCPADPCTKKAAPFVWLGESKKKGALGRRLVSRLPFSGGTESLAIPKPPLPGAGLRLLMAELPSVRGGKRRWARTGHCELALPPPAHDQRCILLWDSGLPSIQKAAK